MTISPPTGGFFMPMTDDQLNELRQLLKALGDDSAEWSNDDCWTICFLLKRFMQTQTPD